MTTNLTVITLIMYKFGFLFISTVIIETKITLTTSFTSTWIQRTVW